uniref:SGNH hydrolase-type esterase domain-containing protein n=1 Tax=Xenopus tropicalis TaxID=8364 RepID=A0A803JZ70_XENTR
MVVIGDSIIRKVDRVICQVDRFNRTVCCLPGARVRHVVDRVDTLLGGSGHDPAVLVHIGTNDKMNGSKIKQRSSKVIFSEILPVPRASLGRQRELRELNAWLKSWCRKEGFGFLEHWADFPWGTSYTASEKASRFVNMLNDNFL